MTDLTQYSGTWTIDPAHTRLGFVAGTPWSPKSAAHSTSSALP